MLSETLQLITTAARKALTNWRAMLLIALVYAALLAVLYFFVIIREATFVQVSLTFASAILTPLLFFVLQAMVASEDDESPVSLLKRSLTNFWKLIVVTLPLIALAILIVYLLGKAQNYLNANLRDAAAAVPPRPAALANARNAAAPIDWKAAMLSTIRYLTFG